MLFVFVCSSVYCELVWHHHLSVWSWKVKIFAKKKTKHMNEGFCCEQRGHKHDKHILPRGVGKLCFCGQWSTKWQSVHVIVSMSATSRFLASQRGRTFGELVLKVAGAECERVLDAAPLKLCRWKSEAHVWDKVVKSISGVQIWNNLERLRRNRWFHFSRSLLLWSVNLV